MRFEINKNILMKNLNYVSKAISSKTPIPALSGIKFDLNNNGLILIGSSLETTITTFIPKIKDETEIITFDKTGTFIINEKYVTEIVRKIEEEIITFELIDGYKIKISTNTATFNLNIISDEEYPKYTFEKSDDYITFQKAELNEIINQTVFSVSRQENRPVLTGLCFNFVGNLLVVNGTDSYRLSHKIYKHSNDLNNTLIIPGKILADLNSICSGVGEVTMYLFGNKVMFEFDNVIFQTKLLEGTYPNTQKIIPEEFSTEFYIDSNSFINTIERASILSRDKTKNVIKLTVNETGAIISSNSPEVGRIEEKINVEYTKPGNFEISFSARFLKEAISSLDAQKALIKMNGDMKPIIITNPEDDSIIQLVLPVRTY